MRDILAEKYKRNMLSLLTVVTVYLAVWGGITADAQVGPALRNSIRHLPAASSPSDAVSASPRVTGTADSDAPAVRVHRMLQRTEDLTGLSLHLDFEIFFFLVKILLELYGMCVLLKEHVK